MRRTCSLVLLAVCLAAQASAEVVLLDGKLATDITAWANCRWSNYTQAGFSASRFEFYRFGGFVGLTARVSPVASARVSFDAGWANSALDIYVDLAWPSVLAVRAGQFVVPTGFEALTKPEETKLIDNSMVKRLWKPWDPRDVGIMLSYDARPISGALAVINGNGRQDPLHDDNDAKDIAARVVLRILEHSGLLFAVRGYHGKYGAEKVNFDNVAVEASFRDWGLDVTAEGQRAVFGTALRNSFYVQAAYRLTGLLEPAGRYTMEFAEDRFDFGVTGGMNFRVKGDRLKLMLDYDHWERRAPGVWDDIVENRFLVQLQAGI